MLYFYLGTWLNSNDIAEYLLFKHQPNLHNATLR